MLFLLYIHEVSGFTNTDVIMGKFSFKNNNNHKLILSFILENIINILCAKSKGKQEEGLKLIS